MSFDWSAFNKKAASDPFWSALSKRERKEFFQLCRQLAETEFKEEMEALEKQWREQFLQFYQENYSQVREQVLTEWSGEGDLQEAIEEEMGRKEERLYWALRWPIDAAAGALAYDLILTKRERASA